jgi:hypothetical protein
MNTQFKNFLVSVGIIVVGISYGMDLPFPAWAQQLQPGEHHPVHPLVTAQVLLVESIALTERGLQDSSTIMKTVTEKLSKAGFTVVSSPDHPHDAVVRVKCEERQTWTGPSKLRNTSPAPTSRLWKGPACHISYRHEGQSPNWSWDVRTPFEHPEEAAKDAGTTDSGTFALQALQAQLAQDDFPLYLAAEWGQSDRLIRLFQQETERDRRLLILQLLGPLPSPTVLATLQKAVEDPALAITAITALGEQGEAGIPILASILEGHSPTPQHLAAIQALGNIATHSQAPALFDQFVRLLNSEDPRVQTMATRGLGKLGDRRAITPLKTLSLKAWTDPSTHPDMQALREAVSWSLWQLTPSAHSED